MSRGFGLLAQADEQEALCGEARRGVQQHGLVGAGLEFAAGQHGLYRSQNGSVGGEKRRLGFGVGGIRGLCVGRQNGQEFSFDSGDGSKRQLSPHGGYYFTRKSGGGVVRQAEFVVSHPFRKEREKDGARGLLELTRPLPPHAVFAGIDGGAGFAIGLAAAFGLALVPVLLALGHGQFAFDPPVAEVKTGGNERVALDLRLR